MIALSARDSALLAEAMTHTTVDELRRLSKASEDLARMPPLPEESRGTALVLLAFSVVLANVADDHERLFTAEGPA